MVEDRDQASANRTKLMIAIGCVVLYAVFSNLTPPEGLTVSGQKSLLLMLAAIVTWIFEIVPIGVASALFVMITGILGIVGTREAMAAFMIPAIFFILSSFIIAIAFVDSGLGNRVSLYLSGMLGNRSSRVLLSFMASTALISSVIADIPTSLIFTSVALPLLRKNNCLPGASNFGRAMMIGIPIAAAIGGIATPAGSGLNLLALSLLKDSAQVEVNFLQWTIIGFPIAVVLTMAAWSVIVRLIPAEFDRVQGLDDAKEERSRLGRWSVKEKKFAVIMSVTITLWFTQPWTNLDPAVVAIVAATACFLPGVDLACWHGVKDRIGWDVLFLVGASNVLAMALLTQQGAQWLTNTFLADLVGARLFVLLIVVVAFGIYSHFILPVGSAMLAVSIPVMTVLSGKAGINPALLVVPVAFCSSCVFLLPLDPIPLTTYQHGYWRFKDMVRVGLVISVIWLAVVTAVMYFIPSLGIL